MNLPAPENLVNADCCRPRQCKGFSTVELLVASAILIVLSAIAAVAFTDYMNRVNTDLSQHQQQDLIDHIDVAVDMIQSGANSGLVAPSTGERITSERTCAEFLDSLKATVGHLRNPYDGSPAVTFSTAYDIHQKRGKIRITCYRMHNDTAAKARSLTAGHMALRQTGSTALSRPAS